jgi:hypothetical protein
VSITDELIVEIQRRLPTKGTVHVEKGERVNSETLIAEGSVINPDIHDIRVYQILGIEPSEIKEYLVKSVGDEVKKDEVVAILRSFFGRFTRVVRSPIDGRIEALSISTGRVMIRGHPIEVKVKAHLPGKVKEVIPEEGAVVEAKVAHTKGVFGVGGETRGDLAIVSDSPNLPLTSEDITPEHEGKIIVGGSVITLRALKTAEKRGVKGVIIGGIDQKDLTQYLGYEIGVGITGTENIDLTIILTEGFGVNPMDQEKYEFLKKRVGQLACIDGTTQIRSQIVRPDIYIPI